LAVDPRSLLDPTLMARLDALEVLTHRVFRSGQKGERRSRQKGISVEFADYREYVRGDDTRHIDWNIFARLERLFVKLYQEEEDLAFHIVVDCSKSMDFGKPLSKFEYARRMAAALAYVALANQEKVSVSAFDSTGREVFRPARGKGQLPKVLASLAGLEVGSQTSLQAGVRDFVLRATQPGIVVLLSDFLDDGGHEAALKQFFLRNYEVYCIHVLSPEERNPPLNGHLELLDAETGEKQEVTVTEGLLKQYRQTLESFCAGIRDWSVSRGMSYLPATTDQPLDAMLMGYLRAKGLLR
jgi:uncharacterized protein (DUF58 family)